MSSTTFFIKQSDTAPSIIETLYDENGAAINLTGAAVRFHLRSPSLALVVDQPATITNAAGGTVRYDWEAADTATAGKFLREWQCTLAGGQIVTVPNFVDGYETVIRQQLG